MGVGGGPSQQNRPLYEPLKRCLASNRAADQSPKGSPCSKVPPDNAKGGCAHLSPPSLGQLLGFWVGCVTEFPKQEGHGCKGETLPLLGWWAGAFVRTCV